MKEKVLFISGIDTDAGKSYATGYMAREFNTSGVSTITQKLVQTGNVGYSEDIDLHRRLMGIGHTVDDREGLTMPAIFSYPCSPHLAARIDNRSLDLTHINHCTEELCRRYECVLLEGAGGLMVPLTQTLLTIDYVAERGYPLVFVTSGRLGSINHTLLSLEAIRSRGIQLHTLAYNLYPVTPDRVIESDTQAFIQQYLSKHFPDTQLITIPLQRLPSMENKNR